MSGLEVYLAVWWGAAQLEVDNKNRQVKMIVKEVREVKKNFNYWDLKI